MFDRLNVLHTYASNISSCMSLSLLLMLPSVCFAGWYWGPLTAAQAKQVLIDAPEGTFLLRDSSYQGYLLTLSVKTSLGPTHLRIEHGTGMFVFDSVIVAWPRMQRFEGAVDLVQHYALTL